MLRKQDSLKGQMMLWKGQQDGSVFRLRYQHVAFALALGEFCVYQCNISVDQTITGDVLSSLDAIRMEPGLVQKGPDAAQVLCAQSVSLSFRMIVFDIQDAMRFPCIENAAKWQVQTANDGKTQTDSIVKGGFQ